MTGRESRTACFLFVVIFQCLVFKCLSSVVYLDGGEAGFKELIGKKQLTLIQFKAPWCGHCKHLKPEYDAAAIELAADEKLKDRVSLTEVDCTTVNNKDWCASIGVHAFPTLKLYKQNEAAPIAEYDDQRTRAALVQYMRKWSNPAVTLVEKKSDLEAFFAMHPMALVVFLQDDASPAQQAFLEEFQKISSAYRDRYGFAVIKDNAKLDNLSQILYSVAPPAIVFVRDFEERFIVYDKPMLTMKQEHIGYFAGNYSLPLIGAISPQNYRLYTDRGLPIVWVFLEPQPEKEQKWLDIVTPIARAFRGEVSFVSLSGLRWRDQMRMLGLPDGKLPALAFEDKRTHKVEAMREAITVQSLMTFMNELMHKIHPNYLNRQPILTDSKAALESNLNLDTVPGHTHSEI